LVFGFILFLPKFQFLRLFRYTEFFYPHYNKKVFYTESNSRIGFGITSGIYYFHFKVLKISISASRILKLSPSLNFLSLGAKMTLRYFKLRALRLKFSEP